MSDILTFEEIKGSIKNRVISWLGDGNNNMSNSLIEATGKFDFELKLSLKNIHLIKILNGQKKEPVKLAVTKTRSSSKKL